MLASIVLRAVQAGLAVGLIVALAHQLRAKILHIEGDDVLPRLDLRTIMATPGHRQRALSARRSRSAPTS